MEALYLEFVNRVNEVGVDVNKCVAYPHTAPLVQFVCGLGPRKGYHLLRVGALSVLCVVVSAKVIVLKPFHWLMYS